VCFVACSISRAIAVKRFRILYENKLDRERAEQMDQAVSVQFAPFPVASCPGALQPLADRAREFLSYSCAKGLQSRRLWRVKSRADRRALEEPR
jgi:hypothetical protein